MLGDRDLNVVISPLPRRQQGKNPVRRQHSRRWPLNCDRMGKRTKRRADVASCHGRVERMKCQGPGRAFGVDKGCGQACFLDKPLDPRRVLRSDGVVAQLVERLFAMRSQGFESIGSTMFSVMRYVF